MPFGIGAFAAEIGKMGIAKSSNFFGAITPPHLLLNNLKKAETSLPLRISAVNIPGRALQTFKRQTIGPHREMPWQQVFPPCQIEVILSEDMWERQFFMAWQDLFVGGARINGAQAPAPGIFDLGYYDSCVGTIDVSQFGESPFWQKRKVAKGGISDFIQDVARDLGFEPNVLTKPLGFDLFGLGKKKQGPPPLAATKLTLREAYPVMINDVGMDWSADGLAKLTVQFNYFMMTEEHAFSSGEVPDAVQKGLLRKIMEGFNRFMPAASVIKRAGPGQLLGSNAQTVSGPGRAFAGGLGSVSPFGR